MEIVVAWSDEGTGANFIHDRDSRLHQRRRQSCSSVCEYLIVTFEKSNGTGSHRIEGRWILGDWTLVNFQAMQGLPLLSIKGGYSQPLAPRHCRILLGAKVSPRRDLTNRLGKVSLMGRGYIYLYDELLRRSLRDSPLSPRPGWECGVWTART